MESSTPASRPMRLCLPAAGIPRPIAVGLPILRSIRANRTCAPTARRRSIWRRRICKLCTTNAHRAWAANKPTASALTGATALRNREMGMAMEAAAAVAVGEEAEAEAVAVREAVEEAVADFKAEEAVA